MVVGAYPSDSSAIQPRTQINHPHSSFILIHPRLSAVDLFPFGRRAKFQGYFYTAVAGKRAFLCPFLHDTS
jgi:hypothetical protein